MFYCEDCRKKNNWPETASRSHGKCEMCGIVGLCYDVPSSRLPEPKKETRSLTEELRDSLAEYNVKRANAILDTLEGTVAGSTPLFKAALTFQGAMEAAEREAERLRHGVPIESDMICPNELTITEMKRRLGAIVNRMRLYADSSASKHTASHLRMFADEVANTMEE